MSKTQVGLVVAIAAFALLQSGIGKANAATIVYDANAAFLANESGAETNPFGPFSAGHFDGAFPGGFTPFTAAEHTNNWANDGALQGWFIDNNVIVPAVIVNTSSSSVTTFFGSTIDPGQILMHPGGIGSDGSSPPIHNAILRFTAPVAGEYTVEGDWESLHPGITENIIHNGTTVFSSTADNSVFNLTLTLNVGDTVDFVVNDFNGIGADSTGLRAKLTTDVIPEPGTLAIWSVLGGIALVVGHRRRERTVAKQADRN